jgi:hypothetical protein
MLLFFPTETSGSSVSGTNGHYAETGAPHKAEDPPSSPEDPRKPSCFPTLAPISVGGCAEDASNPAWRRRHSGVIGLQRRHTGVPVDTAGEHSAALAHIVRLLALATEQENP